MVEVESLARAKELDAKFPSQRDLFYHPTLKSLKVADQSDNTGTYLCGNSLGLMPKATKVALEKEIDAWAGLAVNGHFERPDGTMGWVTADDPVIPLLAKIVGSKESEVAFTGFLTVNLNAIMHTFYKPTDGRHKILLEGRAFPSDNYMFQNQVKLHGRDPKESIILAQPREGEHSLRTEDILDIIEKQGEEIAIVFFSGVQFYTGQRFDIPRITAAARTKGCLVGWDLAHSVGNVELKLHDWDVDFAAFCTYKYLNAGPGSVGGLFIHERFHDERPRPAGWFGVDPATRFNMEYEYKPIRGARGWVQSCTNWSGPPAMLESLRIFEKAGWIEGLLPRARSLTGFLEELLLASPYYGLPSGGFVLITPRNPEERGTQLSLLFSGEGTMVHVFEHLESRGIIGDKRKPDVLRLAPTALYNTHNDVAVAVAALNEALASYAKT